MANLLRNQSITFSLDFAMKLTLGLLSVFLLIITIGAPPVIENAPKDKEQDDSKLDGSDEVVRRPTFSNVLLSDHFAF